MKKKLKMIFAVSAISLLFIATPIALPGILLIDNTEIDVFGTTWFQTSSPAKTIDDNLSTFWHGTDNIQIGDTNFLAYNFSKPYNVRRIYFWNEESPQKYLLGELDIQISQNSTDGLDGDWTTIDHIDGDFNPPGGDFARFMNVGPVWWIRLWMTYQGRAAYGITPAFYLHEIDFFAVPEAAIDIDPDTLNLNSKGKWITCYIELPEDYDVDDIDVSTVKLNGQVPAESHPTGTGDYDNDGIPDLMVKFDRSAVQEILQAGDEVEITVTGELNYETPFEGSDTIRVIDKGGKK